MYECYDSKSHGIDLTLYDAGRNVVPFGLQHMLKLLQIVNVMPWPHSATKEGPRHAQWGLSLEKPKDRERSSSTPFAFRYCNVMWAVCGRALSCINVVGACCWMNGTATGLSIWLMYSVAFRLPFTMTSFVSLAPWSNPLPKCQYRKSCVFQKCRYLKIARTSFWIPPHYHHDN